MLILHRRSLFLSMILLAACPLALLADAAKPKEKIRGDTLYFPTEAQAEAARKLWAPPTNERYKFTAGAADPSAYTEAQVKSAVRPRFARPETTVTAILLVDPLGDVIATQVIASSDRAAELPALRAVQQWKFKPARYRGVPVMSMVAVPFGPAPDRAAQNAQPAPAKPPTESR